MRGIVEATKLLKWIQFAKEKFFTSLNALASKRLTEKRPHKINATESYVRFCEKERKKETKIGPKEWGEVGLN